MYELPLFPLNSVLFPGMPIELHIFEERYKQMIGLCIANKEPFGVVLIRRGRAESGPLADPHLVGCTAHITQVQPLRQGRMNITAIGHERFRTLSVNREKQYLVGMVEMFPISDSNPQQTVLLARQLRGLVERYLDILNNAGQIRFKSQQQLPRDPIAMAYLAAVLLQIPPAQQQTLLASIISSDNSLSDGILSFQTFVTQQQTLLETAESSNLLHDLCKIYRREVALLDSLVNSPNKDEKIVPFSNN